MNPSEEPVVPLDTPQSHTVIPSPVENLSDKEQFEEKIEEARKSFAEFVEPVELPVEPVNEDAIIRGASTEAFLDEVERVNEVADADQMDLSDDVPPTLVQESPQVAPPPAPSSVLPQQQPPPPQHNPPPPTLTRPRSSRLTPPSNTRNISK